MINSVTCNLTCYIVNIIYIISCKNRNMYIVGFPTNNKNTFTLHKNDTKLYTLKGKASHTYKKTSFSFFYDFQAIQFSIILPYLLIIVTWQQSILYHMT